MSFLNFFIGYLSPVHSLLTIKWRGKFIGEDHLGNKYFEGKPRKGYKLNRRWVSFKKDQEASNVPPEWHGWLHHQTNIVPNAEDPSFRKEWQKPHISNKTGTIAAYRPKGHVLNGGQRAKASGDYEAWSPNQDI
ncbi:MAG: NADH:ubiquinone oxidoreductase subunit NDUFA12 [Micavibrio sp.]|nr:NADH:ubiquinone oxidoreductase subunit NDUFA12 [Micavibrio sp.]|tara:strand:+ start:873 stop:1274 length:402 start_codon:yes stop_codon:yes gene_type:complete